MCFKHRLKWLTSLAVDCRSLGWRQVWHWAEVSAREPRGPEKSNPWDWTIIGERPLTGETGLSGEVGTWQLDVEREEGGAGDWVSLGDGLRGGDGSLRGVRDWALGDWEPLEDAEASRRLRANRALLVLAEFFWVESLGVTARDRLGSGSIGWPPEWGFSLSQEAVWELSAEMDLLSSCLSFLSFVLLSSSCPPFPRSENWWSLCLSGWTDGSSQTPRTGKIHFNTFAFLTLPTKLHFLARTT